MGVLSQDKHPTYACHQYSVRLFRKVKCRNMESKAAEKGRFGGGEKDNSKENKGRKKTPLRLCIRGTEEDTPLGSVFWRFYPFYSCCGM